MSGKSTRVRVARKQAIINKGAKSGVAISQIGKHIGSARCIKIRNKKFQTIKKLYDLPLFTSLRGDQTISIKQREMLQTISSLKYNPSIENYQYNQNTPYSIIHLKQQHFENGTVRITQPGIYVLQENIVFHPNPENDFQPSGSDISSHKYPIPGPYQLGFFAAVTIETNDVIFDLNGHSIKQSIEHYLQQRFYANIELGSAPFIMNQGPSNKITGNYAAPKNIVVMNGILDLSSHHGIHGNLGTQVLLYNLRIQEFQVAGIALNGFTESILCDLLVQNTTGVEQSSVGVPINFQYSQARFIRPFLQKLLQTTPNAVLNNATDNSSLTIQDIINNLEEKMEIAKINVLQNTYDKIPHVFKNETSLSDGNVYGILLHVQGVAVNGFVKERTEGDGLGNNTIYLKNITIRNIKSTPEETVVAMKYEADNEEFGYNNKNIVKGPVGDVFDIKYNTSDTGLYISNVLADAQLILGKYQLSSNGSQKFGTTYFTQDIVDWVEQGNIDIDTIVSECPEDENHSKEELEGKMVYKYGVDGMAHIMKGNFGLFVSGGQNIFATNVNTQGSTTGAGDILPHKDAGKDLLIVASDNVDEIEKNVKYNSIHII